MIYSRKTLGDDDDASVLRKLFKMRNFVPHSGGVIWQYNLCIMNIAVARAAFAFVFNYMEKPAAGRWKVFNPRALANIT